MHGHLTAALRRAGVLGDGSVRDVVVKSARDTIVSHIIRLGLSYDGPAADAPQSLILKLAHPDHARTLWMAGRHEVAFYTDVAPLMPAGLTPRCFEGSWNEGPGWHLLLEDLTDSHRTATVWPLPPALDQCRSIIRALAGAHAAWWDSPLLGGSIGTWLAADFFDHLMQQFAGHYAGFADRSAIACRTRGAISIDRFMQAAPA